MLNRQNVFDVSLEASRLLNLDAKAVGRKFRRFLSRVSENGVVAQMFACCEGHTERQLKTLEVYAQYIAKEQSEELSKDIATLKGLVNDREFGLVSVQYQFLVSVDAATVAQLREMVAFVRVLACWMHDFAQSPNITVLSDCPDYVYRNLPCSIVPHEELWCVSGADVRGGAGVLEWCYDEADANGILADMKRFPERFTGLKAEAFAALLAEDEVPA